LEPSALRVLAQAPEQLRDVPVPERVLEPPQLLPEKRGP